MNFATEFGLETIKPGKYPFCPGGDAEGRPGVQVWLEGADIGALLSTGNQTWSVLVKGLRPMVLDTTTPPQWTNIAVRYWIF